MLCAFSALTSLIEHQEEHLACKNWVMRCWCGYLSGARCRLFAYGPSDATAIPKPHHLLPHLTRLVLPFWHRLTQVVLEMRLLNGRSSSYVSAHQTGLQNSQLTSSYHIHHSNSSTHSMLWTFLKQPRTLHWTSVLPTTVSYSFQENIAIVLVKQKCK